MKFTIATMFGAAAAMLFAGPGAADEVTLKAYSSAPKSLIYTTLYIDEFIEPVNEAGKGVVQIRFIGGPEVTPASKSAEALERGVFDIMYGPAGYYAGAVPEAYAIHGATRNAAQLRAAGGFELLDRIWSERIGGKVLGWGMSETGYNLYLTKMPDVSPERLSLAGMKMRSSPTYKPMLESLGATPVSIPAPEFYTSLERGLVVGSGWPAVGLAGTGTGKLMKYKIDPPFFRANHLIVINRTKWDSLSPEAQKVLNDAAIAYETNSLAYINDVAAKEARQLAEDGIETIELTGTARQNYVRESNDALWALVAERSPHAEELREVMED